MDIVLNKCFGGFNLSLEAIKYYLSLKGKIAYFYHKEGNKFTFISFPVGIKETYSNYCFTCYFGKSFSCTNFSKNYESKYKPELFDYYDIARNDPDLVRTVNELGPERASGDNAELEVCSIFDNIDDLIDNHDGYETLKF